MRKVLLYICSVFILGGMTSCEDFLDKREDVGLTEDDIFRDYYSLRGFLDQSFNQLENVMVMDAHLSVSLQTRWQPQIIHLPFLLYIPETG